MKRIGQIMNIVSISEICVGIIMSAALLFCGTPVEWMSVAAVILQLVFTLPASVVYFLEMNK